MSSDIKEKLKAAAGLVILLAVLAGLIHGCLS
jgi:hypothetical protein